MTFKFYRNIFLVLAMLLQGCSNHYSAQPIEAWVVDADTKQPIEGVIVAARWKLEYGMEGGYASLLNTLETETDKNGRFYFPAWGPKKIPDGLPSEARLKDSDPALELFKSGYRVQALKNDKPIASMSGHGTSLRSFDWNGRKIQLTKLRGTQDEYGYRLPEFFFLESCEWQYLPKMILATIREQERFKEQNVPFPGGISIKSLPGQDRCGSAEYFFKEYTK